MMIVNMRTQSRPHLGFTRKFIYQNVWCVFVNVYLYTYMHKLNKWKPSKLSSIMSLLLSIKFFITHRRQSLLTSISNIK